MQFQADDSHQKQMGAFKPLSKVYCFEDTDIELFFHTAMMRFPGINGLKHFRIESSLAHKIQTAASLLSAR